jgi:dihydroceramidase
MGYWGNVTATLDWCEENYSHSHYVAEFYNTFSNLIFLAFAIFGMKNCYSEKLEARFYWTYTGLLTVGVGSFLFHGTLQYHYQLLDELPMIYVTLMFWYNLTNTNYKQDDPNNFLRDLVQIMFIGALGLGITMVYVFHTTNPIFHQVAYGILVACVIFKCFFAFLTTTDPVVRYLFPVAVSSFLGGFAVWNVDNAFCSYVHPLKLHAWWHILTAYGSYLCMVYCIYARNQILNRFPSVVWFARIIPYVKTGPHEKMM